MKNKSLLMMMLLCFAVFGVARAQMTLTVHDGTATNSYVPVYGFYADAFLKCEMVYPASELGEMEGGTINQLTFYASSPATDSWGAANFQIFMTEVGESSISAFYGPGTLVYEGSLDGTQPEIVISLTENYNYQGGNLLVGVYNTEKGSYKSITWLGEQVDGASVTGYSYSSLDEVAATQRNFLPKTSFEYTPNSTITCFRPQQVAVNYEGGSTATVTWVGDASNYNIKVNGTVTNNVTSPYTLTGLYLATEYSVELQANCGGGDLSTWTTPVSFVTDLCMPEDQCELTFTLTDSYGDGWNGNALVVTDVLTGNVIASLTNQNLDGVSSNVVETQTIAVPVCDGREIAFSWVSGSYATETSYTITDLNGDVIFEGAGGAVPSETYTVSCVVSPCRKPTNLTASEIKARTAKLSWTENGESTAWDIKVNGNMVRVSENPYTLTGLAPETSYTVQVCPVCEVEKWSDAITFKTEVACPAPTALEVVPSVFSADVTWTGDASNYTLRYASSSCSPDPSQPATIVFHADNIWNDGSGYQMLIDADANTYGSIIPETGALSTECTGNEAIYAEFEYKIPANADGECTTSNIVLDNTITIQIPAGTYDWCITNPTPGDRVWIASAQGSAGGRADDYVFEGGQTYEFTLYMLGSNDATDVDILCSNIDWNYVYNATSPCTINGLEAETEYYVSVQAVCGGEDGESAWVNTSFTTASPCDAPTNLNVTNLMPTSATLNWTGYQDGYEVRYKPNTTGEVYLETNFDDSSFGEWTTIDADGDGYDWVLGSAAGGVYLAEGNSMAGTGYNSSADMVVSGSYSNVEGVGALMPDNYLISPLVDLGGSITFYACGQDAGYVAEHFGVAVSTTSNTDPSAFTTIAEWDMTAKGTRAAGLCRTMPNKASNMLSRSGNRDQGTWHAFTVDLSGYTGQGYVAIRHFNCTDMFMLDVDDITISGPSSGDWIESSLADPTLDIAGLIPETEYVWQVRGVDRRCDEGFTEWSGVATFTTPSACDLPTDLNVTNLTSTSATLNWTGYQESFEVRYKEVLSYTDFEDGTLGDWTSIDADGDGYEWMAWTSSDATSAGYNGSLYTATSASYQGAALNPDNYLVSPLVPLGGSISFMACAQDASWAAEHFGVAVSTSGNTDAADFETIFETDMISKGFGAKTNDTRNGSRAQGTWYQYTIDLSGYSGEGYVAIRHFNCTDMFRLNVDDIVIATLSSEWIENSVADATLDISGLSGGKTYMWQVRGVERYCDGGFTEWSPVSIFTTPVSADVEESIEFSAGWNWFSSYVEYPENAIELLEASIAATNTEATIKYVSNFNQLSSGTWIGGLTLENELMYMASIETPFTHVFEGPLANPADHPINLASGWSWISFLSPNQMSVSQALSGLTPADGDQIKSPTGFSTYKESTGEWIGGLQVLDPSHGYQYFNNASAQTLIYPSSAKEVIVPQTVVRHWDNDYHRFATNLTMMVTLDAESIAMSEGSHEIGAFVNGECRGSALLKYVDGLYIAFLTVSGEDGEEVSFRLFDVNNNEEFAGVAEERINYHADNIYGSLKAPMTLHFRNTGLNEYNEIGLFPNPTKDKVMIEGQGIETVKVYNAMGQLLYTEVCGNAVNVELNLSSYSAGVYTVNVRLANGHQANRMVVKE